MEDSEAGHRAAPHDRAYDFFKHLTGVSLFTAASIVTAGDKGEGKQVSDRAVRISMGIAVWSLSVGLGAAIQTFAAALF